MADVYDIAGEAAQPDPEIIAAAERRMNPQPTDAKDTYIAAAVSFLLCILCMLINGDVFHWFLLPLMACGTLFGRDMVALVRKKMDLFDAKGLIGFLGYINTFLAPLLVATFGDSDEQFTNITDWPFWLGWLGIITFAASLLYMAGQKLGFAGASKAGRTFRVPGPGATALLLGFALLGLAGWLTYYIMSGGAEAIARSRELGGQKIRGMGPLIILGEAAPWMIFAAITVARGLGRLKRGSAAVAFGIMGILFVMSIFLAGLQGSRSRIITTAVAILVLIHYFWFPIRRRHLVMAIIPLTVFTYAYTLYKDFGSDFLAMIKDTDYLKYYMTQSDRTLGSVVAGPLCMSQIQSSILQTLVGPPDLYDLRWGKTFVFGTINWVPGWLMPDEMKPWYWSKAAAAVEQAYGKGVYEPDKPFRPAVRIFALAGESMLNFGIIGPLLTFPLWGFLVGRARRYIMALPHGDIRLMVAPLISFLVAAAIVYDMDNLVTSFVWSILPLCLLIFMASRKVPMQQSFAEPAELAGS